MKEIKRIIDTYDTIDHETIRCALASVVDVEGSAYRRIGARMLVMSNGIWVGGISGGCLEGDALKRANIAIFKNEPSMTCYDTRNDDENQIGVGLGCNGKIDVLFTPIEPSDPNNSIELLRSIIDTREEKIVLTIHGSSSDRLPLGFTELLGIQNSSIPVTKELLDLVPEVKRKRKSKVLIQGDLKILIEYMAPATRLIVYGDNYDVNTMVRIADEIGWEVHIIGNTKKIEKRTFNLSKTVNSFTELDKSELDSHTAVILMAHDYDKDREGLRYFGMRHDGYLGVLGPKKRLNRMLDEIKKIGEDVSYIEKDTFYSPLGLNIGAESPEEIALSAIAEIVAFFKGHKLNSLKYKEGPIHDRV